MGNVIIKCERCKKHYAKPSNHFGKKLKNGRCPYCDKINKVLDFTDYEVNESIILVQNLNIGDR